LTLQKLDHVILASPEERHPQRSGRTPLGSRCVIVKSYSLLRKGNWIYTRFSIPCEFLEDMPLHALVKLVVQKIQAHDSIGPTQEEEGE
jgi:hypothetical protein